MLAPLIHTIPVPVVFGVLLYLGVASLSHIQLVNRIVMLFMAPKHHPDVRYVRKVRPSFSSYPALITLTVKEELIVKDRQKCKQPAK